MEIGHQSLDATKITQPDFPFSRFRGIKTIREI